MPDAPGDPVLGAIERSGLRALIAGESNDVRAVLDRLASSAATLDPIDRALLHAEATHRLETFGLVEADKLVGAAVSVGRGMAAAQALTAKSNGNGRHDADSKVGLPVEEHPEGSVWGDPLLVSLASVEPELVQWLWPGWIPRGKLTILDGDPGLGKSTLLLDLAARVTVGGPLPDGGRAPHGSVVLLTAEDGLADTVRPRLDNLGADLTRVQALTGVRGERGGFDAVTLPLHLPALRAAVERTGALLVIVDPFTAFLDGQVNSRIDHDVRRALAPLARLAEDTGAAIVLVRHLNKSHGGPALYRGGGSIGMIGAARAGLLVAPDPDDADTLDSPRRVLAVVKTNLAPRPGSLRFTVAGGANGAARIDWNGTSPHRADRLLAEAENDEDRGELRRCVEWLGVFIAEVPRTSKEVAAEAREAGFSEATLRRARRDLGITTERVGGIGGKGGWVLRCSNPPANERLSKNPHEMGTSTKVLNERLSEGLDPDTAARDAMRDGA